MATSLLHRLIVAPLPYVPQSVVWQLSRRYVAGTDLASACDTVVSLNALGCSATIDVLGENSTTRQEVDTARDLYLAALNELATRQLDCNASIKLSDLGLRFDTALCYDVLETIVAAAAEHNNFVRIDMEDSSVTSSTLDIYRKLRETHSNAGTVIV